MKVELVPALVAGALGGATMLVLALIGPSRTRFDVAGLWAQVLGLPSGSGRIAGFVVHLAVSGAVGVLYALAFRLAEATDAGLAWGVVGSVIHWLAAGAYLALRRHDDRPPADKPAAFGSDLGPAVALGVLVAHLAYGAVFGVAYFALHPSGGLGAAL